MDTQQLQLEFDAMRSQGEAMRARVALLESKNPVELADLQSALNAMIAEAVALRSRLDNLNAGRNAHYESLLSHPGLVFEKSMREPAHYLFGRSPRVKTANPYVSYDATLDAAHVSLPPRANEMWPAGHIQYFWSEPWLFDVPTVVQHDFLISQAMRDLCSTGGTNGRSSSDFKFTNLCRGDHITYELRFSHRNETNGPSDSTTDVRCYLQKLEGRQERDSLCSDVADPTRTYYGTGGGFDSHPGPDSNMVYKQPLPHPHQFRLWCDQWIRITYELTRVQEGTRVKVWLADETYGPSLIVASPINPSLGFLTALNEPITAWFLELDTSQETTYAEDMPDRWCAFRNLVVLRGVSGDSVLGGRPKR